MNESSEKTKTQEEKIKEIIGENPPKRGDERRLKKLLNSNYLRALITFFLLIILFVLTFFIAYQSQQKKLRQSKTDINAIPEAEIKLPMNVSSESDNNVKAASDIQDKQCLEQEENILEEISRCRTINENICMELKKEFDDCLISCQKYLSRQGCFNVCKPTCDKSI